MGVFRVTVKGEGLRAIFDGAEIPCGFYKNEFVWAKDQEEAVLKARANVEAALRRKSTVNQADLAHLQLDIEEVEVGLGLPRLLQRQGFVFHRLHADKDGAT